MNSLFEQLTNQMREAIESAISLALHSKNNEATPLHVLWALLSNSASILNQVFNIDLVVEETKDGRDKDDAEASRAECHEKTKNE